MRMEVLGGERERMYWEKLARGNSKLWGMAKGREKTWREAHPAL